VIALCRSEIQASLKVFPFEKRIVIEDFVPRSALIQEFENIPYPQPKAADTGLSAAQLQPNASSWCRTFGGAFEVADAGCTPKFPILQYQ
jgi:hypothetical protein